MLERYDTDNGRFLRHRRELSFTPFVFIEPRRDRKLLVTRCRMGQAIGFDPVDDGLHKNARSLGPLAFLNIQLSWALGNGLNVGFQFAH